VPISYIGILSRFAPISFTEIKYKWLFILSGPEPQRTILENKFLAIIPSLSGKCLLVRALPLEKNNLPAAPNCTVFNHLSSLQMQKAFEQSEFVISRSGYTTVMELLSLQKKSILIPTPGQTEQEYLAQHLMSENLCYATAQEADLLQAIKEAENFAFNFLI